MSEEQPTTNGVKSNDELDDSTIIRPADIEAVSGEKDGRDNSFIDLMTYSLTHSLPHIHRT